MYLPSPQRPRYWKAVVATALFVVPLSLLARLAWRMNDWEWIAAAIVFTAAIAVPIHLRTKENWLDQDGKRFAQWEERTRL